MDDKKAKGQIPNAKSKKEVKEEGYLSEKVDRLEAQLKHALADYHNLSKRIEKNQSRWRDRVAARVIDKMLDVYDDFVRAEEKIGDKGLSMAEDQFWSILSSEGVEKIEPQGQEFDADRMDCVKMVNGPKNEVIKVTQTGYLLNDEVIRPAKVTVGQGSLEPKKEETKNE